MLLVFSACSEGCANLPFNWLSLRKAEGLCVLDLAQIWEWRVLPNPHLAARWHSPLMEVVYRRVVNAVSEGNVSQFVKERNFEDIR